MKKKAGIIILTAILIVSFYNEIYSQPIYRFHQNRNIVMASSGLNIRSQANTTSTKLVNVPFGQKVQILHKDHYGLDTLYTIKTELGDHPVYGFWQKVKYQDYVGYVHNAFLSFNFRHQEELIKDTNTDFVYLQPGYDCADEFYNTNEYFWYGYYQEEVEDGLTTKKPYRKMIDVEFINIADEMTGSGTIVKENKHLKFIIGSKKALPETKMMNILERPLFKFLEEPNLALDSLVKKQSNIMMVNQEPPNKTHEYPFFYLTKGDKMQLINKRTENYRIFISSYYVQADLDGDGLLDYIFGHDFEGGGKGLYLSSEATEEEVAKLVSLFLRGPCC